MPAVAIATNPPRSQTADPTADELEPTATPARRRRTSRRVGLLAVIVATLALLLSACSEQELTDYINGSRAQVGAQALTPNLALYFKATGWSQYMASIGQLTHSNLATNNPYQWSSLGENIGVFPASWGMAQVNQAFYNSSAHRANMLNPAFNYIGIGIAYDGKGNMWVTEEFMQL